jgi:hypothetical protein
MAVVQISRIQIRRGKAQSGTGIPQLASGELAWALDTQELYIGNGSVAEGAPAVGNTKIITELDLGVNGNILNILKYIYKSTDTGIQTGPTANDPIERGIQERLDDQVNLKDFISADDVNNNDYTASIQRAIDQLYANNNTTPANANTADGVRNRVVLNIPAGIYPITSTLLIPSYATIIGEGQDKTIIQYSGSDSIVSFVNDTDVSLNLTQTKHVKISGITFETDSANAPGIELTSVRDSEFSDIAIVGNWTGSGSNTSSKGLWLDGHNIALTYYATEQNTFKNISITKFSYAVYAKQDIRANYFSNVYVEDCRQGFVLGGDFQIGDQSGAGTGQTYGPRETFLSNARFYNVKQHAINVYKGTGNTFTDIQLINVGNDGGGNRFAAFPQIFIWQNNNKLTEGNVTKNIFSDRSFNDAGDLSYVDNAPTLVTVPYIPEVAGYGAYDSFSSKERSVTGTTTLFNLGRLPLNSDDQGNPTGVIHYTIDYHYTSDGSGGFEFSRKGVFNIVANYDNQTIQYSDDYDYLGSDVTYTEMGTGNVRYVSQALDLRATFLDQNSQDWSSTNDPAGPKSIGFCYYNLLNGDQGTFTYSYKVSF